MATATIAMQNLKARAQFAKDHGHELAHLQQHLAALNAGDPPDGVVPGSIDHLLAAIDGRTRAPSKAKSPSKVEAVKPKVEAVKPIQEAPKPPVVPVEEEPPVVEELVEETPVVEEEPPAVEEHGKGKKGKKG